MAAPGGLAAELRPVMTFRIADEWVAVGIEQLESVELASQLWPVPMARSEYIGLHDNGDELVPILALDARAGHGGEQLFAVLQVRGESVGLAIQRAGQVHTGYTLEDAVTSPPALLASLAPRRARSGERSFWLIDTDKLWSPTAVAWV